jgi:hypothetical protein
LHKQSKNGWAVKDHGKWLLVFDKYGDILAVEIHDVLPTCDAGHMAITSRRSDLQALGRTLEIDEIDEIDERSVILLFLKSSGSEELIPRSGSRILEISTRAS